MKNMSSNRPYLIRAYYDWIVDNNLTPHLVVDASQEGVVVPPEHVKDGQIVLNISPSACGNLQLGGVDIEFDARFSGVPRHLIIPCSSVLAIYARENGAGTMFPKEDIESSTPQLEDESEKPESKGLSAVDTSDDEPPETPDPKPPTGKKGKPTLKIVK